ncbi:cytochrome P450 2U1 [Strongylocentrotus purpuratus]|uniref:Cytochrome P450 n=1 Tax=Strongylocentrotus purpuratus TaxID=7668 RepID=A0A7M7RDI4_STRPU|nr:cytochrome P450 2U1 [Strongylocentrotus purpuratus]
MANSGYVASSLFFGFQEICYRECIIVLTTFLFVRLLVSRGLFKKSTPPSNPPPPSPTGLPFFGNLFSFQEDMRHLFRKWTNEIGGIFRLRIGPVMDIVVINDVEAVREAFVEKADAFSDRMVPPLLGEALGKRGSLIWPAGGGWKKTRKFGHSAFRSMGLGHRRIEEKVVEEGRILVQACEMKEGEPFNPRVLITNAVGNMIACLVTGSRYDYGDPDFVKIVGDIERFSQNLSLTSLGNVFPLLYYTPLYTDFRRPMRDIISYIKSMVKQHQQNFDPLNVRDIIDLYIVELKQQREQQIPGTVEENLEWRLSIELYIAGMVTTSDSMLWAILIVAQHPQLMKEIQKEIDDVIGDERSPKMADQDALPLIVATLMEVSRIRPAVPLGVPRLTSRDATLQGYHIPKDTVVIMNLWEVLNSPKYWDKPEEFNPYRFLSEDRRSVVNHPAFIPFGIGLRACLGEKLARMQMFIIFTSLLQRFTFCLADDSRSAGMKGKAGMAYSPLKYDIILKRRENSD